MFILGVGSLSTLLPSTPTYAANTLESKSSDLAWQAQSLWYYQALSSCMKSIGDYSTDEGAVKAGRIFKSGNTEVGGFVMRDIVGGIGNDGKTKCTDNDNELFKQAASHWGISNLELACNTIYQRGENVSCMSAPHIMDT
jgi:hypothetical protein